MSILDVFMKRSPSCKQQIVEAKRRLAHAMLKLDIATHLSNMQPVSIEAQRNTAKRVKP